VPLNQQVTGSTPVQLTSENGGGGESFWSTSMVELNISSRLTFEFFHPISLYPRQVCNELEAIAAIFLI